MLKKDLPLIELTIDPEDGSFVQAVALVENPAVEIDFIAFSKQEEVKFAADDEMMELLGVAMQPNQNIFRNSPQLGEYACVFSKDTIRQTAQVFAQKGLFNRTNIEHSIVPADSYIFQSYITDESKGIAAPKGVSAADGSWIIGVKVLNPAVWQDIKAGNLKGFSVEGIFNMIDRNTTVKLSKEDELDKAIAELEALEKVMLNIQGI